MAVSRPGYPYEREEYSGKNFGPSFFIMLLLHQLVEQIEQANVTSKDHWMNVKEGHMDFESRLFSLSELLESAVDTDD